MYNLLLKYITLLALILLSCTSCASSKNIHKIININAGDHTLSLNHQDRTRTFIIHVPPGILTKKSIPLIINFHGGGGNAKGHQQYTKMDVLADREGVIVVYPNGTGKFNKRFFTWNAGGCCGYAAKHKVDDVGFVIAIIDAISKKLNIDKKRIYATGLSNGAMMTYRLATDASNYITAIAPVAGVIETEVGKVKRSVPIMQIHSVDDPRALFEGGLGPPFPYTNNKVNHPPVMKVLNNWIQHNQCYKNPKLEKNLKLFDGEKQKEFTATKLVYSPCFRGADIILWRLTTSGHVWPGGTADYLEEHIGLSTGIINANEEMWDFFKTRSLE